MTFKEYITSKGIDTKSIGDIFSFSRVEESQESIKFYGVYLCDNIQIVESHKQYDTIYAVEIMNNGDLNVYEDISTITRIPSPENPFIGLFQTAPLSSTNINTLRDRGLLLMVSLVNLVKGMSIEDARAYMMSQGGSTEEKLLGHIIKELVYNPDLTVSNGV